MALKGRKLVIATATTAAFVTAAVMAGKPFITYGVDWLSINLRGHIAPDQTLYLMTTRKDGDAAIDGLLNDVAEAKGWRISRAGWQGGYGNGSPEPRELWRPGASVWVTREFACRRPDDEIARFRTDAFIVHATKISFLTNRATLHQVMDELRSRAAASQDVRVLPARLPCPGDIPASQPPLQPQLTFE